VRLSWGLHGSQIWLYHPRMCPSLCSWMSAGQMCIVCKVEVPGCFLGVTLSGFGSCLRFRYLCTLCSKIQIPFILTSKKVSWYSLTGSLGGLRSRIGHGE